MKLYIGPYINWAGPYQIAEKILFWKDEYKDYVVHQFGNWLATDSKGEDSYLMKFCTWLHSKRKRKVKIHIDNYDVWNMDSTLALIILPMLKKLKENKQGFHLIDNADVPEELRDADNSWCEKKYNWFLDELVWAFELYNKDKMWEYDQEKMKRIDNALLLFGKYYKTLWD
jgi:hypothetical protein